MPMNPREYDANKAVGGARTVIGCVVKIELVEYPSDVLSLLMHEAPDPAAGDFRVTLRTNEGETIVYQARTGDVPRMGEYVGYVIP